MNCKDNLSLSTAVLIFAHSDKLQSTLKPIAYNRKQNELLWHKMNERVLTLVQKTKLPYFISNENAQQGDSFGEKLSHAIQSVLDKGYDKVIVLGNDSPGLRLPHLQEAFKELQANNIVLGPDFKGGTYLMGISGVSFNKEAFAKIDWQTPKVLEQLQALYLDKNVAIMAPLADCNTKSDFEKVLQDLPFYSTFRTILSSLLFYLLSTYSFLQHNYTSAVVGINFNKGSPILE